MERLKGRFWWVQEPRKPSPSFAMATITKLLYLVALKQETTPGTLSVEGAGVSANLRSLPKVTTRLGEGDASLLLIRWPPEYAFNRGSNSSNKCKQSLTMVEHLDFVVFLCWCLKCESNPRCSAFLNTSKKQIVLKQRELRKTLLLHVCILKEPAKCTPLLIKRCYGKSYRPS